MTPEEARALKPGDLFYCVDDFPKIEVLRYSFTRLEIEHEDLEDRGDGLGKEVITLCGQTIRYEIEGEEEVALNKCALTSKMAIALYLHRVEVEIDYAHAAWSNAKARLEKVRASFTKKDR